MAVYGVYRRVTSGGVRVFSNEMIMGASGLQEVLDRAVDFFAVPDWTRVYGVRNGKLVHPTNPEDIVFCDLLNVDVEFV